MQNILPCSKKLIPYFRIFMTIFGVVFEFTPFQECFVMADQMLLISYFFSENTDDKENQGIAGKKTKES